MATQPAPGASNLILIKVTFLKEPHSGRALKSNAGGVWIDALELAAAIQRAAAGVGHAPVPQDKQFLKGRSILFIPFNQIEWILAGSAF
jgi:hypothetical protein